MEKKEVTIILKKDIGKYKKDDIISVSLERKIYWDRVGVASEYVKPKEKPKKEK